MSIIICWAISLVTRVGRWLGAHWRHALTFWRAAGRTGVGAEWEVRYAVRYVFLEYPHRIAYCLLGLGCFIALAWGAVLYARLDDAQTEIRRQASTQTSQQAQIAGLLTRIQMDRKNTSREFCVTINDLSRALRQLIVGGARASKPFDAVYRKFGFPPYKQRVVKARQQAATIPHVDCATVVERIERSTPPPPLVSPPNHGNP